jgi:hypothetical protein
MFNLVLTIGYQVDESDPFIWLSFSLLFTCATLLFVFFNLSFSLFSHPLSLSLFFFLDEENFIKAPRHKRTKDQQDLEKEQAKQEIQ